MPDTLIHVDDITENLDSLKNSLDEQMLVLETLKQRFQKCTEELEAANEYCDTLVGALDEVKDDVQELQSLQPIVASFKELCAALQDYFGQPHEALQNETDFRKQIAVREIFQNLNHIKGEIDV